MTPFPPTDPAPQPSPAGDPVGDQLAAIAAALGRLADAAQRRLEEARPAQHGPGRRSNGPRP